MEKPEKIKKIETGKSGDGIEFVKSGMPDTSALQNLSSKLHEEMLAAEGFTQEDVDMVDLSIAYSPVIPLKGGSVVEAIKTQGDNYLLVDYPIFPGPISPEVLKIMRYRYLINRNA